MLCPIMPAIEYVTVCFAELIFSSLIRISALNPKSGHYVTLATPRAVPGRRAKAFVWRKVVPLARVTLPSEVRQLAHPSCLALRDEFAFAFEFAFVNGWLNFGKKQAKRYLGQRNSGPRDHINGALVDNKKSQSWNQCHCGLLWPFIYLYQLVVDN